MTPAYSYTEIAGIVLCSLLLVGAIVNDIWSWAEERRRQKLIEQIKRRFRQGQPPYVNRHGHLLREVRRARRNKNPRS